MRRSIAALPLLVALGARSALALTGDVNGDSAINGTDAQQILESIVGARTFNATQAAAADVDGDGVITALDALMVHQFAVSLISSFPARLPQNSSPIAVSRDGVLVGVVNPDSDSVTLLDTQTNLVIAELAVGNEPASLAFSRDASRAFVTNSRDGTVSVIDLPSLSVVGTIAVGVEPFGIAVNFRGDRAYVANMASATVSEINLATQAVVRTASVAVQPQALAISSDSNRIFVTHLRGGQVSVIDATTFAVTSIPLAEIPFNSLNTLQPAGKPNRMKGIAIHPTLARAWLPHILSNSGNFVETLFNTSIFPAVAVLDTAVPAELPAQRMTLFAGLATTVSNPEAVAFSPNGSLAYLISAASNDLTVINSTTRQQVGLLRDVGDNPRGIAVTPDGTKAYVFNRLSPKVTVVNLATTTILANVVVSTDPLPPNLANGRRLFFTSAPPEVAQDRFFGCEACHFDGRDDGQTWFFTNGPRQTLTLAGGTLNTGLLHHNADRVDVKDFAATFTRLQNGTGLTPDQMNDLADFVNGGIRFLENPFLNPDGSRTAAARSGRRLFKSANCEGCHSGAFLTDATGQLDPANPRIHDVGIFAVGSQGQDQFDKTRDQAGIAAGTVRPAGSFESTFLNGVWSTPPFLHDGRAATLLDVLTTANPSNQHGITSSLTAQQRSDLVAYMREADITNARVRIDFPADAARVVTLTTVGGAVLSDVTTVNVFVNGAGPVAATIAAGRFSATIPPALVPAVSAGTPIELTAIASTASGEPGRDDVQVIANFSGVVSTALSLVDASPTLILANGTSTSLITISPKDSGGNLVGVGLNIVASTSLGTLSAVQSVGDGTYRATLTSTVGAGTAVVTARRFPGAAFTDNASVTFAPGTVSAGTSAVSVLPTTLEANGISTATVSVIPRDAFGNALGAGQTVSVAATAGTVGAASYAGNGIYTVEYRAPSTVGSAAILTATVNAVVLTQTASVTRIADVTLPVAPILGRITFGAPVAGISLITGGSGSVEALSTVRVTNTTTSAFATTVAGLDGSFSVSLAVAANQNVSIRVTDIATNQGPSVATVPFPQAVPAVRGFVKTAAPGGGFIADGGELVELATANFTDPCNVTFSGVGSLLNDVTSADGSFEIILPGGFSPDLSLDPDREALAVITGPDANANGSVDSVDRYNLVNNLGADVQVDEFSTELAYLMCDNVCSINPVPVATRFSPAENAAIETRVRTATTELDFSGLPLGQISFDVEDDVFFDVARDSLDQIAYDTYCAAASSAGDAPPPTVVEGVVRVPSGTSSVPLAGVEACLATVSISGGLNASIIRCANTDASGHFSLALAGTPPHGIVVVGNLTYNASGIPGAWNGTGSSFRLGSFTTDASGALSGDTLNLDVDLAGRAVMSLITGPGVPIANFNAGELDQLGDLCRTKISAAIANGTLPLANRTLATVFTDASTLCATNVEVAALLASISDAEGNTCNVSVDPGPYQANGVSQIGITITPVDSLTNPIGPGRLIGLSTTLGQITTPAIDQRNNTYRAFLRAPTTAGTAKVSLTLEGAVCPQSPGQISLAFTADNTAPAVPVAGSVQFTDVGGATLTVIGVAGSVEPGSRVTVFNVTLNRTVTVIASADGSFRADIQGALGNSIQISVADLVGNTSAVTPFTVPAGLTVPGIANTSAIPGGVTPTLTALTAAQLGLAVPAGYTFVGGFDLGLAGQSATAPLSVLVEATGAVPADPHLVLAQVITLQQQPKLRVVSPAVSAGGLLLPVGGVGFPGVITGGKYAFLSATTAQAFVTGTVSGSLGLMEGARTSLDTSPFVDLTRANGAYLLAGPVGLQTVVSAQAFSHVAGTAAAPVLLPYEGAKVPTAFTLATRATRSFAFSGRFGSVGEIAQRVTVEPGGGRLWVPRFSVPEVRVLDTSTLAIGTSFNDTRAIEDLTFTPNGFEAFIGYLNVVRDFTVGIEEPGLLISQVGFPRAVATTPDGELALVASSLDNSTADTDPDRVFVIDTFSNITEPIAISVGADPSAIAVNRAGTRAYVSSKRMNTLTVINLPTRTVMAVVPVGTQPVGVAVSIDDTEIYVANAATNNVTVLNAALAEDAIPNNQTIATIAVGASPSALAVTPDDATLIVPEQSDDTMSVINLTTLVVSKVFATVDLPADVAIHPDGTRAYVLDRQTQKGLLEVTLQSADTTVPLVVDAGPQDRRSQLLQDSPIEIVFNEALNPATVNSTNIQIRTAADVLIAGTLDLSDNGVAVVFKPNAPFRYALNSTVKVNLGTGLTDVAGNHLAAIQRIVPTITMELPDPLLISMNLGTGGVVVTGSASAVESKSLVEVRNLTSNAVFSTTAAVNGSFSLKVDGLNTDGFELVTSIFNGRARTNAVPVIPNFTIVIPNPGLVSYQAGPAGTLLAVGAPGAVDPQSSRIRIRNVTTGQNFDTTTINPNGSFSVGIFASQGNSLQLISTILGAFDLVPVTLASPNLTPPALVFLTPGRFTFGDPVTLTVVGTNLGTVAGNILLRVDGVVRTDFVLDVVDGNPSQRAILVGLPAGADSGTVQVTVAGQTSNTLSYSSEIPTNTSPFAEQVVSSFTTGNPSNALGQSDANFVDLGQGGNIVLRLGSTVRDGPGMDLQIFEDTADSADCYQVLVSASSVGPFDSKGQFCGNAFVDLAGHNPIRFVRIVDANDGGAAAKVGGVFAIRVELSIGMEIDGVPLGGGGGGGGVSVSSPGSDEAVCAGGAAKTFSVTVSPPAAGGGGYGGGCTDAISWTVSGVGSVSPASGASTTFTPGSVGGSATITATVNRSGSGCSDTGSDSKSVKADVVKLTLVTPDGDPVASPVVTGTGQNEYTFNASTPGVLDVHMEATADGGIDLDKAKEKVKFTIEAISGSALAWNAANPGGKASVGGSQLVADVAFTGLPASNNSFGKKKVTLECDGTLVKETNVEVFYDKTATNHPGGGSDNWFYYWNQTGAGYAQASWNTAVGGAIGMAPAMRFWSPTMTHSKTEIWIYFGADGSYTRRDGSAAIADGIDMFANVVVHERYHNQQIANADGVLGALNGKAGSVWVKGWRWNAGTSNHKNVGPDGKPGKAGIDDDADGTIDEDSDMSEIGFAGSDDVDLDTNNDDVPDSWAINGTADAIEKDAQTSETVVNNTHAAGDWGDPGKNHDTAAYDD